MIVAGVVLVLWGADRLTDGAVALAERMKISQIVIGLTIVAVGTSAPEFCVSLVSALKGTADLAVGNVVGSNIFNAMLITGVAAMVAPMTILPSTVRKDIPIAVVASLALTIMVLTDGDLSRLDAAMLLAGFIGFMWLTLHGAKDKGSDDTAPSKTLSVGRALLMLVVGLACLVAGSNIFVDGATEVAARLGVSEAVIGLTVVAGGTSLPELATSVVAARKGNSGIAIGNVLGSNVMNILLILGGAGLICPMTVVGITTVDFAVLTGSILLLWLFANTKLTLARWEGVVLTVLFLAYMTWLVAQVV
jgi:cation:H+ antiporter